MEEVKNKKPGFRFPYWTVSVLVPLLYLWFSHLEVKSPGYEDGVFPCSLILLIPLYIAVNIYFMIKIILPITSFSWSYNVSEEISNAPQLPIHKIITKNTFTVYLPVILELSLFSLLMYCAFYAFNKNEILKLDHIIPAFSMYLGEIILITALTLLSVYISYTSKNNRLFKSVGLAALYLTASLFWIISVFTLSPRMVELFHLQNIFINNDNLLFALNIQLSSIFFIIVSIYYVRQIYGSSVRAKINESFLNRSRENNFESQQQT